VVATKVYAPMHKGANGMGLSRKAILEEVEASLRRLGTDYIDLYQIHRWDPQTPIEETLEALNDLVRSGKVLYLGASSLFACQPNRSVRSTRTPRSARLRSPVISVKRWIRRAAILSSASSFNSSVRVG